MHPFDWVHKVLVIDCDLVAVTQLRLCIVGWPVIRVYNCASLYMCWCNWQKGTSSVSFIYKLHETNTHWYVIDSEDLWKYRTIKDTKLMMLNVAELLNVKLILEAVTSPPMQFIYTKSYVPSSLQRYICK